MKWPQKNPKPRRHHACTQSEQLSELSRPEKGKSPETLAKSAVKWRRSTHKDPKPAWHRKNQWKCQPQDLSTPPDCPQSRAVTVTSVRAHRPGWVAGTAAKTMLLAVLPIGPGQGLMSVHGTTHTPPQTKQTLGEELLSRHVITSSRPHRRSGGNCLPTSAITVSGVLRRAWGEKIWHVIYNIFMDRGGPSYSQHSFLSFKISLFFFLWVKSTVVFDLNYYRIDGHISEQ